MSALTVMLRGGFHPVKTTQGVRISVHRGASRVDRMNQLEVTRVKGGKPSHTLVGILNGSPSLENPAPPLP